MLLLLLRWVLLILATPVVGLAITRIVVRLVATVTGPVTTAAVPTTRLWRQRRRRPDLGSGQVNKDAAVVGLGGIVEAQLAAHLLDAGLDFLHATSAVVALADNYVQVPLAPGLGVANAGLENVLGLLDELTVQVDGVLGHALRVVVLPEYVLRGLLIVALHVGAVLLALVGEALGFGAVAIFVRLAGLGRGVWSQEWFDSNLY